MKDCSNIPLTIHSSSPHLILRGGESAAKKKARVEGYALWPRANGSARLYYIEGSTMRQKTWKRYRWVQDS